MSIPNYSILPVSISDIPILATFVHSSKLTLTINRLLFKDWPNEAAQRPLYTNAVESSIKDPSVESFKVVEDESKDIIGYVVLTRKQPVKIEQPTDTENEGEKKDIPVGVDPDVYATVGKAAAEIAKDVEETDRFALTYLYVKPSSRNHGIGSQLVRVCFERAKAEGVPLALCSEPGAYNFFVKLGFRDTRHYDIDLSKWAPAYSGFGIFRLAGLIWSP